MARVSPIPAELVARATVSYDAVQAVGETVYWIEGRPSGDVLVRWTAADSSRDVLPEGFHVASYVHEYGGGAYLATERDLWFCNADDQRIYRVSDGLDPVLVTPAPVSPGALRYADLRLLPGSGQLICVRERHEDDRSVHNELVILPGDGSAEPRVIASGDDFYMSPEPSPDGMRLAWVSWNAPLMPWDGSCLWVADIQSDGSLVDLRLVAGGEEESVCQPRWSPDGVLHLVSDRSGWWNLYAWRDDHLDPVITGEFEVAAAPWEFGYRTYAFRDAQVVAVIQQGPQHHLAVRNPDGALERLALPFTSIKPYLAMAGRSIAFIGSSPAQLPAVMLAELDGSTRELASADLALDPASLVRPEPFVFSTRDGAEAYGLYYPPLEARGQPPPLLVRAHPGPTANWPLRLDLHAQYFTSRGFAVADIDYRGSIGYGRAYRLQLRGRWGTADATDCADAALHLAATGRADLQRMAIWGASAGGYTVLCALATSDVFAVGIARSAVVDLETWSAVAPKFQAHHAELLHREHSRGVSESETEVRRPLLLVHGGDDRVAPLNQVETLAQRLGRVSHLLVVPKAGHTVRNSSDVRYILRLELEHLRSM
ncbi:Dipeptidyl aminopeptidase/acylaminoacyl peptidase [Streptosporangium subroseum]|uniref:Dipeptidyl aminopeptidase/acylaminoacyl peptidase n=1 Tax=Streptosporangium subroseum TaxID=106412 RepID=A0A239EVF5_9ACTN|nr:prolyl oligopeptidase family serine peptidase [Streptosporangium subroseum]SNS47882.1 Dipeptidyl aminopeptidase/acylaminoacyl peptidase [Streptosporangium subroseum]